MALPLPPGALNITGSVVSPGFALPVIGEFGVLLLHKDTQPLNAQDCFPRGVVPVRPNPLDGTFSIPNVAAGEYTVLAYRRTSDQFERTSVTVNVVDRDVATGPITLLAPLDAEVQTVRRNGRPQEIVSWRAPAGPGFQGYAYLTSREDSCYSTTNDLDVDGTFWINTFNDMDYAKVLIEKAQTRQVAIRIQPVDGDDRDDD